MYRKGAVIVTDHDGRTKWQCPALRDDALADSKGAVMVHFKVAQ